MSEDDIVAVTARPLGNIYCGTCSWTDRTLIESGGFYPVDIRSRRRGFAATRRSSPSSRSTRPTTPCLQSPHHNHLQIVPELNVDGTRKYHFDPEEHWGYVVHCLIPNHLRLAPLALLFIISASVPVLAQVPGVAPGIFEPTNRNVIQLFNWRFVQIQEVIPRLKDLGYSHIHVSPPERSNERVWQWWGRYQPIDFSVISGPLGNEAEFKAMNDTAHANGVNICVDVVANHTLDINEPEHDFVVLDGNRVVAKFPQFELRDFHDRTSCNGGVERSWLFSNLIDTRTEDRHVRDIIKQYLTKLVSLGADCFRWDAAKHIEPAFFTDVLSITPDKYAFGEIVARSANDIGGHLQINLDLYDFPLAAAMREAFAFGGNLFRLENARAEGRALEGVKAVTFVRNHGIDRGQAGDRGVDDPTYGIGWDGRTLNRTDVLLAYAFILGREAGLPLFADMPALLQNQQDDRYDDPDVVAAIRFHNLSLANPDGSGRRPNVWRIETPNVINWQRGADRFIVINKAAEWFSIRNLGTSLQPGTYLEVRNGWQLHVQPDKLGLLQTSCHLRLRVSPLAIRGGITMSNKSDAAKPKWPSVEEQLEAAGVIRGSGLEKLIRENQDFHMLSPEERMDNLGLPLWLRVYWRKAHPEGRYSVAPGRVDYPRVLKSMLAWMLTHQDVL